MYDKWKHGRVAWSATRYERFAKGALACDRLFKLAFFSETASYPPVADTPPQPGVSAASDPQLSSNLNLSSVVKTATTLSELSHGDYPCCGYFVHCR